MPQDVPLLASEEPPERREAVDLQAIESVTFRKYVTTFMQGLNEYVIIFHNAAPNRAIFSVTALFTAASFPPQDHQQNS